VYRFRGWRYSLEGPSFGYALIVAAMLYMLLQLFVGRPRRIPANADLNARIALFRCELGREHDFHGGYWFWSRLVIMTPGFILLCVGGMIAHHDAWIHPALRRRHDCSSIHDS
jgi:hypothetical protein